MSTGKTYKERKKAFDETKETYEEIREVERQILAKYLKEHPKLEGKLKPAIRGRVGKGAENYSCNGKIPTFNLKNWKWVKVVGTGEDKDFSCVISLNMPDIAPDTGIPVALYDRIGLIWRPSPKEWVYTDIDLPLDTDKMEKIVDLVLAQYKEFKKRKGV